MLPWVECGCMDLDLSMPLRQRYAGVPQDVLDKGRRLLAILREEFPDKGRFLADAARLRTGNRFHAEAKFLASLIGGSWREIMIANLSYDLVLGTMGCSTVALPTPSGPVLARNMDWWPEDVLAQTSYLIRGFRDGRLAYANAGWPGAIGVVTGLSGNGFAIALNAVIGPDPVNRLGYPMLLHIRRVLEEAADFANAVQMLSEQPLVVSGLLTVVGTRNDERVIIERTPRRHAQRWGEEGRPLIATNDFRALHKPQTHELGDIYQTTCSRYEALSRLVREPASLDPSGDSGLLYILSDPAVIQEVTAQHVIVRPQQREIRLFVPRRLLHAP